MKGPPAIRPRFETLDAMLDAAGHSGESLFFVGRDEQDRQIPMDHIRRHARSVAAGLRGAGVAAGDRVALVLPTGPEFVAYFFGVLCAGAIPVPLYPPVRLGKLDEYHRRTAAMLRAVQAALVVTGERVCPLLGVAIASAAPRLGCVTASGVGRAGGPEINSEIKAAVDDVALIQFSSGTTHDPKPVALTHKNLLCNLAAIADYFACEGTPDPVGVTWLPLYHDMGLIGNLLMAFYLARPLVLLPPELFLAVPAAWLRAISRHGGTYTAAPNFAFGLCLKRIRDDELAGVDLSSWSLCLNGAEMISAEVLRGFSERFGRWGFDARAFTPCYGLAEASVAVTFKPAHGAFKTIGVQAENLASAGVVEPGHKELVSAGRPLAGVDVEIRGDDSSPVPPDRVGSIFVRGPSVMAGYFGRADLNERVPHNGWLDSGDLGFVHDGELFVCGRSKETVIIRGANHAPHDFEAALDGLPGVRAGCAVAVGYVPPDAGDEALAMLVETTPGAPPGLASDVAARVLEHTGIAVHHVELLAPGTLPRTSSGKLRRLDARARWLAGTLSPPQQLSALRLLLTAAKGRISKRTRVFRTGFVPPVWLARAVESMRHHLLRLHQRMTPAPAAMMEMIVGGWAAQAITASVELGVADALADGPLPLDELAARVGADADALRRLLRALIGRGIFRRRRDGRYALNSLADTLRSDAPISLTGAALFQGSKEQRERWTLLADSVRTGKSIVPALRGKEGWDYLAENPQLAELFNQTITSLAQMTVATLVAGYDFGVHRTIVDVGGGQGTTLAAILAAAPGSRGVLYDLPRVVATAPSLLRTSNVADRVRIAQGSFFDSVPTGGDAYLLKNIVHDWADDKALQILRNVRAAAGPRTTVLLVEIVVGENGRDCPGNWVDLEMLLNLGSRERTAQEYRKLLGQSGFRMTRVVPTASPLSVVEAVVDETAQA